MSVIRMLTRLCAVAALRGRTWADDRVFDSDNTPLSEALTLNSAAKPYIVVYTDADNRIEVDGTDLYGVKRELSLVLEIGVASKVEGATGEAMLKTPLTDEGMEIALDMVEDQAVIALFGNPQSAWSELLKEMVISVERMSGQRGASAERDRRWAARQLAFVCDVVSDIPLGVPVPPGHPIRTFTDVAKAHPEANMDHVGEICEALVSQTSTPKWEQVQASLGLRRLGLRGIGQAPLTSNLPIIATRYGEDLTDANGEAPVLREIILEDEQLELKFGIGAKVGTIKTRERSDKIKVDGDA
jgi:hypothetical protein